MAIETVDLIGCDCCNAQVLCCCLRKIIADIPTLAATIITDGCADACYTQFLDWPDLSNLGGVAGTSCLWLDDQTHFCNPVNVTSNLRVSTLHWPADNECELRAVWRPNTGSTRRAYFTKRFDEDAFCGGTQLIPWYATSFQTAIDPLPPPGGTKICAETFVEVEFP